MTEISLRTRADLSLLPTFALCEKDSMGQPALWRNGYHCEADGTSWDEVWSCQCEDRCSQCGSAVSPEASTWIGPPDRVSMALWETLPEVPLKGVEIPVETDGARVSLPDGWIVIGSASPSVVRAGPWPAFDAFMRSKVKDLPAHAIVYEADVHVENGESCRLMAGVIRKGKVVLGTARALTAKNSELAAFCETWEKKNLVPDPETPDSAPSMF